jgi:hypothetical protein
MVKDTDLRDLGDLSSFRPLRDASDRSVFG